MVGGSGVSGVWKRAGDGGWGGDRGVPTEERRLSRLDRLARATVNVVNGVGSGGEHDDVVAVTHVGMSGVESRCLLEGYGGD